MTTHIVRKPIIELFRAVTWLPEARDVAVGSQSEKGLSGVNLHGTRQCRPENDAECNVRGPEVRILPFAISIAKIYLLFLFT
jgi:hypothetical protein